MVYQSGVFLDPDGPNTKIEAVVICQTKQEWRRRRNGFHSISFNRVPLLPAPVSLYLDIIYRTTVVIEGSVQDACSGTPVPWIPIKTDTDITSRDPPAF